MNGEQGLTFTASSLSLSVTGFLQQDDMGCLFAVLRLSEARLTSPDWSVARLVQKAASANTTDFVSSGEHCWWDHLSV